jgi:two-component system, sensor histidine kinase and response regulator
MLPMALVFGLIGATITTFYGYHRLAICLQRDRLAEELGHNEKLRGELTLQNEALARLELANRRTTKFMAHDFKTALNCVGGFASQLLERPALRDDADVAEARACIGRQAHRLTGSVQDLLQLARVREKGAPPMQRLSVAQVLHEAASDFSLPAHAAHIGLGDRHMHCPPVLASPELLRRVLCNLISNAVKHNGPDTHVLVDADVSDSGQEVVFSCRDDGAGIPSEVLPKLFCQFAPGNGSSNGSTGLGLAFCKAAVEAHWGRIWGENLAQGSQFCFTIPLDKEHSNGQCTFDI